MALSMKSHSWWHLPCRASSFLNITAKHYQVGAGGWFPTPFLILLAGCYTLKTNQFLLATACMALPPPFPHQFLCDSVAREVSLGDTHSGRTEKQIKYPANNIAPKTRAGSSSGPAEAVDHWWSTPIFPSIPSFVPPPLNAPINPCVNVQLAYSLVIWFSFLPVQFASIVHSLARVADILKLVWASLQRVRCGGEDLK